MNDWAVFRPTEQPDPGNVRPGPAVCRRRLGNELRQLREARSLRLEDVVARLGVQPSTLSRIETGHAPTRTSYLTILLDLYGVEDQGKRRLLADQAREGQRKSWHAEYRELLAAGTGHYLDLETAACKIRGYSAQAVPGLLQTQDYAAAACQAIRPDLTSAQARQLAVLQTRRQGQLYRQDGRDLHLVIDEAVLLRRIGTQGIMARQLNYLLTVAADCRVRLQVAPLANITPALSPSFTVLSFADPTGSNVGCCAGPGGQIIFAKRDSDLCALQSAFDALAHAALSPDRSADLIKQAATRWEEHHGHEH
jgi:transcriptional regulator with XRE-family HTH domain